MVPGAEVGNNQLFPPTKTTRIWGKSENPDKPDIFGIWVEIHQALLSQFSLLAEFFIGKVPVKDYDSEVLMLVNLTTGHISITVGI